MTSQDAYLLNLLDLHSLENDSRTPAVWTILPVLWSCEQNFFVNRDGGRDVVGKGAERKDSKDLRRARRWAMDKLAAEIFKIDFLAADRPPDNSQEKTSEL